MAFPIPLLYEDAPPPCVFALYSKSLSATNKCPFDTIFNMIMGEAYNTPYPLPIENMWLKSPKDERVNKILVGDIIYNT